jgi:hypothetical protein
MMQMKKRNSLGTILFICTLVTSCTPIATTSLPRDEQVLISYTNYVDGGDELINCLEGSGQPNFILYENGHVVIYKRGQYLETWLAQKEIDSLLAEIEKTSIMRLEKIEEEGFDQLILQGNVHRFSRDNFPNRSVEQTINLINQFEPSNLKSYVPENLLLWVNRVENLTPFEEFLPKPIPQVKEWSTEVDPLSKIGVGFINISGEKRSDFMKQFNGFPDYQIFKEENALYITAICATFP